MAILLICLLATVLNLPFGVYRAGVRKFSWQWFLAVHLPVPLIIVIRIGSGIGWRYAPLLIVCAIAGQLLGGRLRQLRRPASTKPLSLEKDES